ncbi:MAG: hypothetical protein ABIN80_24340 [Dyadobacter sp.]|uniref:hypothetical protein n=1 Tax=Dyadobacter sp. TaxID=1914288 RepID=UPI003266386E
MKKLLTFYLPLLFTSESQAQFTSGNSFFVSAATTVSIDGLTLKPTFNNFSLTNKALPVSSVAIPGSPHYSIQRVYIFNEPVKLVAKPTKCLQIPRN